MTDEATEKRTRKDIRRMVTAEYLFTNEERIDLSNELGAKIGEKEVLEDKKKNLSDQMKNEISVVDARITDLARKVRSGSEFREFFCRCEFDWDGNVKRWYDIQTGEIRKTEPITAEDLQMRIRFDEMSDDEESEEPDVAPQPPTNGKKQKAPPEAVEDASYTEVKEGGDDE